MIVQVSNIKTTLPIEEQTVRIIQLIYSSTRSVSTHYDSALRRLTTPAHHSIIPHVCHVDVACRIDPHSVRIRQLLHIRSAIPSTRHNNPFLGALHPFHHTMIPAVRHVDSVFSIHPNFGGIIELMGTRAFSISTSHHGATRLSAVIASHFMLPDVSDVEWSLVIHRQSSTTGDVGDRFFASSATSTWPPCQSIITDDETIGLFVDEHIFRVTQLIRSNSFSVATGQHCPTRGTSLPFHDAVVAVIGNDHRVFLIYKGTVRPVELIHPIPFSVSSSDSDPVLCPPSRGCNKRDANEWERMKVELPLITKVWGWAEVEKYSPSHSLQGKVSIPFLFFQWPNNTNLDDRKPLVLISSWLCLYPNRR